jgi:CheY-like chemotaxis protein
MATQPLILVADDDADIRKLLSEKLEAAGVRVILAESGQDAIDKCRNEKPNLVVMDVRMPVMSGTEAVSLMKSDAQLKNIPIMFLSNFGEENILNAWIDQKYAKELGAIDYVKKGESLENIVEKIMTFLASAPSS